MSWCPCKNGCINCGHFGVCKACGRGRTKPFLAYYKEIDDYQCVRCGHWQGKDKQDYLDKNGYTRLQAITEIQKHGMIRKRTRK